MLRKSLIPVLVALMIAVGTTGLAHARTESPIDAPITVKELMDSPAKLAAAGYEMVMASGEDHAARVLVTAQKPLKNFRIVAITLADNDDPNDSTIRFRVLATLHVRDMFTPDTPICAVVPMMGSIPNIGFSYTAEDGTNLLFTLNSSGKDGSLYLSPVEIANK